MKKIRKEDEEKMDKILSNYKTTISKIDEVKMAKILITKRSKEYMAKNKKTDREKMTKIIAKLSGTENLKIVDNKEDIHVIYDVLSDNRVIFRFNEKGDLKEIDTNGLR